MKCSSLLTTCLLAALSVAPATAETVIDAAKVYGIKPDTGKSVTVKMNKALASIRQRYGGRAVKLVLQPGRYDFYPDKSAERTYYISNHDQDNPKIVGIPVENIDSLTIEGNGAELMYHGRMLPLSVVGSRGCEVRNVSIDFEDPQIAQVTILSVDSVHGTTFRADPYVRIRLDKKGNFEYYGLGWTDTPYGGMVFEPDTRRLVYKSGDRGANLRDTKALGNNEYNSPFWFDPVLKPGMIYTMRSYKRPDPGIFASESVNPTFVNVAVHYAEGMGLLAQLCDSVTLRGFGVKLRGKDDPRYFTTQADATHFSGCKGKITSVGGLYEGMMDDAINVHGTYLKVVGREGARTLVGRYMHGQSYGFKWGEVGDSVSFVRSRTMDLLPQTNFIESITPIDAVGENSLGAKNFRIVFRDAVPDEVCDTAGYGIENLSWAPEVYFAENVIRNNRARGSLFSTPRPTLVENNLFDHTSGTAILLCGDCNGWYETGACRDVTIRNNKFVNALTSYYQFTEAVISIYPEIPDLAGQKTYFHGGKDFPGVRIHDNEFVTFDAPVLYAKSIRGLSFNNNKITLNHDYPAFHRNKFNIRLQHTDEVTIEGNSIPLSIRVD